MRIRGFAFGLLMLAATSVEADANEAAARHHIGAVVAIDAVQADADYAAWTEAGAGKLRYADGSASGARVLLHYRGQLAPTVGLTAAADFDGIDGDSVGLTELALDWRPVPTSGNRHRLRAGAVYPPFSVENGDAVWSSPFGLSFSAINAWLAEEIRPIGVEWQTTRRLRDGGSRHELGGFASAFYGNDPAGTLLFWRGFALHDRQTRLNERIPLPAIDVFDAAGNRIGREETALDAIAETDGRPGYYAGVEWRLRNQALVQLARYDNRADPESFRDGQWGWDTRFWHASMQWALPGRLGLLAQWMDGATDWLSFTTPTGARTSETEWVRDDFDSRFLMLTRVFAGRHRLSVRRDVFGMHRDSGLTADEGDAWTLSYRFDSDGPVSVTAEAMRVESQRDLWPFVYGLDARSLDTQFRLRLQADFSRWQ